LSCELYTIIIRVYIIGLSRAWLGAVGGRGLAAEERTGFTERATKAARVTVDL
jgi:hypothetical protein